MSIVIKNALVYDGTGAKPVNADIAIKGDTIEAIGSNLPPASITIDAKGKIVSPGFIDTHGHSEFTMLACPSAQGKLMQGITTDISGNCGLSGGPLIGAAKARREADQREYDISERWETLGQYLELLEARRPAINYATLAGHGNIRASAMGYDDRPPTADELNRMKTLLRDAVNDGAIGLSSGLIYPPGVYSDMDEMAELVVVGVEVYGDKFIYASHMRSEGDALLESIAETLEVGRRSGAAVHISHIKTAGRRNWDKIGTAIELIDNARAGGMCVTCDRYPYTSSSTDLDAVLPAWMFEGGTEAELARLEDPQILAELQALTDDWPDPFEAISISDVVSPENKWVEGLNIIQIADKWGLAPFDAIVKLLRDERLRVGAIFASMSEDNLARFLSLPYCMIGSDSSARCFEGVTARGMPHPRGFGSMPRFLRMAHDAAPDDEDALCGAIHKITWLAAETFGLSDRGMLAPGMKADIVVFDAKNISDRAEYGSPFIAPVGVEHVIVNGELSIHNTVYTEQRAGRILRGSRDIV